VRNELIGIEFTNASAGESQLAQIRARIRTVEGDVAGMEQQHMNQEQERVMVREYRRCRAG